MNKFVIRPYTKKELALLYFAYVTDSHAAVNRLMAWINRCQPLLSALHAAGYRKTTKVLSPREVTLIVDHLGEP